MLAIAKRSRQVYESVRRKSAKRKRDREGGSGFLSLVKRARREDDDLLGDQLPGDAVWAQMWQTLRSFKIGDAQTPFEPYQMRFLEQMMHSVLPKIYGADWFTKQKQILQRLGIKNFNQYNVFTTPRQYGKTTVSQAFLAACMYCLTDFQVLVFSTGMRASVDIMRGVWAFLGQIPGARSRKLKKNQEDLEMRSGGNASSVNRMKCLPGSRSSADKLRGQWGHLLFLEEAGFIDEEIFYDVVMPMLNIVGRGFIGISTLPKTADSYYLSLYKAVNEDTNKPLFNVVTISNVCQACQDSGKRECKHKQLEAPSFKSAERMKLQKAIYGVANQARFNREILGVFESDDVPVFESKLVDRWRDSENYKLIEPPKFIFIGIDPSGGARGSNTGLSAHFFDRYGNAVVSFLSFFRFLSILF